MRSNDDDTAFAFSVEEFSKRSGLKTRFLYREIQRGRLRARKAGRRTIIMTDDGRTYLHDLPVAKRVAA